MKTESFFNILVSKQELPNRFAFQMGELIAQARQDMGLSQSELAAALGLSLRAVIGIENGSREVAVYELVRMGWALQRPLVYFLPPDYRPLVEPSLTINEFELLRLFGRLGESDRAKMLAQLRGLVEYLTIEA